MRIIDTSVIIDFLKGNIDLPDDSAVTVISLYELLWKTLEKGAKKEFNVVVSLFSLSTVLPLDIRSVERAAEIKYKLRKIGLEVNDFDILIAGIAMAHGIEEIWTKDKDFEKISKVTDLQIIFL